MRAGDPAQIQAELAPLLAAAGPPLLGGFTETDFTAVAAMLAEAGPPSRVPMMQQFLNLRRLSPATVDTLVGAITPKTPTRSSWSCGTGVGCWRSRRT